MTTASTLATLGLPDAALASLFIFPFEAIGLLLLLPIALFLRDLSLPSRIYPLLLAVIGAALGIVVVLPSFRHNWQDRLREAGLHGTAIAQELAGRTKGGDSSDNYGSGHSTAALAEAVAKIAYPDLIKLPPL